VALRDELESAEREVVEAERRSAVGEMTVALHHEINNPLMAALTETALLMEEHGLTPGVVRGLGVIRVALERIRSAVKRAGEADGAQNVDYLAGTLKMIDLDGPKVIPGLLGRALIAAEDPLSAGSSRSSSGAPGSRQRSSNRSRSSRHGSPRNRCRRSSWWRGPRAGTPTPSASRRLVRSAPGRW
jgi:hypothetical protein